MLQPRQSSSASHSPLQGEEGGSPSRVLRAPASPLPRAQLGQSGSTPWGPTLLTSRPGPQCSRGQPLPTPLTQQPSSPWPGSPHLWPFIHPACNPLRGVDPSESLCLHPGPRAGQTLPGQASPLLSRKLGLVSFLPYAPPLSGASSTFLYPIAVPLLSEEQGLSAGDELGRCSPLQNGPSLGKPEALQEDPLDPDIHLA